MAALKCTNEKFFLNGKELRILSGAMHYFRVVPDYWKTRMLQMKACGLNCIETYVAWNVHEKQECNFDFEGILNLRKYVQTAMDVGLLVIIRPGPYICAEWDLGGLPSWLLRDRTMRVRSSHRMFIKAVDSYLTKVFQQIVDLQYSRGGPIIGFQVENEYGSYDNDAAYKDYLVKKYVDCGVVEWMFTSDNGTGIQQGNFPTCLITSNFQEQDHGLLMFEYLKNLKQPDMPLMVMEFWTGWFDHWGEKHHIWPIHEFEKTLRWILSQGASVNFYMFHGGTNFGFMAGANKGNNQPYAPDITSYDYDAPISENGELTEKWHLIKKILAEMCPNHVPQYSGPVPQPYMSKNYGSIQVEAYMESVDILHLAQTIAAVKPLLMEDMPIATSGQSFGFIWYRKKSVSGEKLSFPDGFKDRITVLHGHQEVASLDWRSTDQEIILDYKLQADLHIVAENTGRVNYGDFKSEVLDLQRKGVSKVLLDGEEVTDWDIFSLDFADEFLEKAMRAACWKHGIPKRGPCLLRANLTVEGSPADTFINTKGWTKGVLFINGFNLGRYWAVGPQETLYLPAPLLKPGRNTILVFEMHHPQTHLLLQDRPSLGPIVHHQNVLAGRDKALTFFLKNAIRLGPWVWKPLKLVMKS